MRLRNIILFVSLSFFMASCIIVKEQAEEITDIEPMVALSPKPEIPMSDVLVRSSKGDMISYIPVGWFFVDVEERVSPDIIAVAVNQDFTLSAVFSTLRQSEIFVSEYKKDGLFGIARQSFARRERKTAGAVKLIGKYQNLQIGNKEFVKYQYSTTGGALLGKSAVFVSSIGEYYEFSLIPMNITGKQVPDQRNFDRIFRSFLAVLQY